MAKKSDSNTSTTIDNARAEWHAATEALAVAREAMIEARKRAAKGGDAIAAMQAELAHLKCEHDLKVAAVTFGRARDEQDSAFNDLRSVVKECRTAHTDCSKATAKAGELDALAAASVSLPAALKLCEDALALRNRAESTTKAIGLVLNGARGRHAAMVRSDGEPRTSWPSEIDNAGKPLPLADRLAAIERWIATAPIPEVPAKIAKLESEIVDMKATRMRTIELQRQAAANAEVERKNLATAAANFQRRQHQTAAEFAAANAASIAERDRLVEAFDAARGVVP